MARIVGVDLPKDKRLVIALTYIHGVGLTVSKRMIEKLRLDPSMRVKDMAESDVLSIRDLIRELVTEGDLKVQRNNSIRRLQEINCYRGRRHKLKLPSRGQRTKTNARTRRGGKKVAVARKKKAV